MNNKEKKDFKTYADALAVLLEEKTPTERLELIVHTLGFDQKELMHVDLRDYVVTAKILLKRARKQRKYKKFSRAIYRHIYGADPPETDKKSS